MNALVIYQSITQRDTFPPSVLATSILTITAHAYVFLVVVYMVPPIGLIPAVVAGLSWNVLPFGVGVVYVVLKALTSRRGGMGMDRVDKAVVGLLVAGHVPQIVMAAAVRWYVSPRVYRAWLETFAPDWEPGKTDWMLEGVVKAMKWIGRVGK